MKKIYKTFETERLHIRPTEVSDAVFILELVNTPKWFKYIGDRNVKSIGDAKEYIKNKMLPQLEKLGYSNYTVIRKSDNMKIGTCGLYDREGLNGIDLGFAFLPKYEKKGYAYESVRKLKEVAVTEFKLSEINAITNKDNKRSQILLEKIGLKFEKMIKFPNEDMEVMYYTFKD